MSGEDLVARAGRTMDFDGMLDLLLEAVAQIEALTAERDTARAELDEADALLGSLRKAADTLIERVKDCGLAPGEIVAIPRDLRDREGGWEFQVGFASADLTKFRADWLRVDDYRADVVTTRCVCRRRPSTPTESGDER